MTAPQPQDFESEGDYMRALREYWKYHAEPDEDDNGFCDGDCDYWESNCYGRG